jgi:DNA gyrase subunit B
MVDAYAAGGITVLEGLECVRRRPGMYVGDTRDGSGLHHLLWECVSNVIDEHLAGHAAHLRVSIRDREVTVEDDGRGIPVDIHGPTGKTALEVVFTMLHAGGLAPVNALSTRMEVSVKRDGQAYRQVFERGRPARPLEQLGPCAGTGTRLRFTPDAEVFGASPFDRAAIRERLEELAFLNPRLTIRFDDDVFWAGDGLHDFARRLGAGRRALHAEPLVFRGEREGIGVECALFWCDAGAERIRGFVCQFRTDQGAHVSGLVESLYRAFRSAWPDRLRGVFRPAFHEVIGPGLNAIVQVTLCDPRFSGCSRSEFWDPAAYRAVLSVTTRGLRAALAREHGLCNELLARMPGYQRAGAVREYTYTVPA